MSLPIPLRPTAAAARVVACLALPLLGLAAGCGGGGGEVARYESRGVVVAVPDPGDELTNLRIRHEAIDDFRSIDGEVVGMDSMTMPFPLAEGVTLAGIEVGDPVAFTLEVEWDGDLPYRISRIEELPAGTELEWRDASPPGGGEPAEP